MTYIRRQLRLHRYRRGLHRVLELRVRKTWLALTKRSSSHACWHCHLLPIYVHLSPLPVLVSTFHLIDSTLSDCGQFGHLSTHCIIISCLNKVSILLLNLCSHVVNRTLSGLARRASRSNCMAKPMIFSVSHSLLASRMEVKLKEPDQFGHCHSENTRLTAGRSH